MNFYQFSKFGFNIFFISKFRIQAKEKITDAARQSGEEGFFNPSTLEQVQIEISYSKLKKNT